MAFDCRHELSLGCYWWGQSIPRIQVVYIALSVSLIRLYRRRGHQVKGISAIAMDDKRSMLWKVCKDELPWRGQRAAQAVSSGWGSAMLSTFIAPWTCGGKHGSVCCWLCSQKSRLATRRTLCGVECGWTLEVNQNSRMHVIVYTWSPIQRRNSNGGGWVDHDVWFDSGTFVLYAVTLCLPPHKYLLLSYIIIVLRHITW